MIEIRNFVCASGPGGSCPDASRTGARDILGTLILIGKEYQIVTFCDARCCDCMFRIFLDGGSSSRANPDFTDITEEWSSFEREIFLQKHWQMRSPCFHAQTTVMNGAYWRRKRSTTQDSGQRASRGGLSSRVAAVVFSGPWSLSIQSRIAKVLY